MLDFFKRKKPVAEQAIELKTQNPEPKEQGLFTRLKDGLRRTRQSFSENLANVFLGKKVIDEDLLEALETVLLTSDLGSEATEAVIADLTRRVKRNELNDPQLLANTLKEELIQLLKPSELPLILPDAPKPFVVLMVGVNGAGKTTTIGKLAKRFGDQGKSVMLAAGDTFRAAAIEQLKVWGERNHLPVIAQHTGADSASVIFDAFQAAKAKNIDVLIADTAGRLHTQSNLMEELKKVIRVLQKLDSTAPHEVMLVIDAGNGQNSLNQAKMFHQAVGVTGVTLTKLDGTAKGGIIFNIAKTLKLPIRFIGIGEHIDDLKPFSAIPFVDAILSMDR